MITVFTSCYNQGEYLSEAIESVLNQTYQDFEYLIYDDGSTDNTREVMWETLEKVNEDDKIRTFFLEKQPNVATVINKSIEDMRGDVWVWLPADDMFSPRLLEEKIKWHEKYNHEAVLYSDWTIIDGNSRFVKNVILENTTPDDFAKVIFNSCPIGCTGIWIPKEIFTKTGNFNESYSCSEDYEWVLRAVSNGVPFVKIPEILYSKRHHENRNTARERRNIPEVVERIRSMYK